ncbi:hypothetical protein C6P45_000926 [Maudiozyma exigua]|uniref:CUE domain-containing protein n=1 Tax=Maudiozyma exigua TaxID=34358 RepID=A0A9P7B7I0_MAUEX|nr:hypothetical protein C6P45_000926 [Kazachstania exigua]
MTGGDNQTKNDQLLKNDIKLCQLVEMFPDVSSNVIENALKSSNNDINLSISFILSDDMMENLQLEHIVSKNNDSNTETIDPKLSDLYEMFPKINSIIIRSYFDSHKEDIKKTIADLLDYEILSKEDAQDQKRTENFIKNSNKGDNISSWGSTQDKIDLIVQFTEVDEVNAHKCYQNNHMNAIMAIIDIIQNNIKNESQRPQSSPLPQKSTAVRRTGRVQSAHGIAYGPTPSYTNNKKPIDQNSSVPSIKPWVGRNFIYSEHSEEMMELESIISSNVDFRNINPMFIRNALKYYNGSVEQTIDCLMLIITNKGSKFTFINNNKEENQFIETNSWKSRKNNNLTTVPIAAHYTQTNNSLSLPDTRSFLYNLFDNYKLDFHGLLPSQATDILSKALRKWWDKEIEEREMSNKRFNLVNVCCVNPLIVITGRGIHSVGGISKVRIQVRKYLNSSTFVFDEEPSFFVIYGKKSK